MRVGLVVRGTVQGVGFRPFVRRLALGRGLSGFVQNGRDAVRIEVQGDGSAIASFTAALVRDLPAAAVIDAIEREAMVDQEEQTFSIVGSETGARVAPVLPPDLSTCRECFREIAEPSNRRYRYPFTNCVECGPRFSICVGLPYDRSRTSMDAFPMCDECAREYRDVDDRRYHAQPIACARCGPTLRWLSRDGGLIALREEALHLATLALADGKIVALRGLGGFQLLCDATNGQAVARLRERKRRPHKPFAVMFARGVSLTRASPAERALLESPEAPIVLISSTPGEHALSKDVAPGRRELGAMLPPSPLHRLLLDGIARPLVCTSGNVSEEPICIATAEAVARLGSIADGFLTHDREIVRPLDDSLVRVSRGSVSVLRRARGYAPRAVAEAPRAPSILALGAQMKSTISLALDCAIVPSQHLGDLDTVASRELLLRTVDDLCSFFDTRPRLVACDLHPDYGSSIAAERLAEKWRVPVFRVQHHHAHVAACMAEHGVGPDEDVIGLAWDGTGLGEDETIWGGEVLKCRGGRFSRFAHLRSFPLVGGDAAAREPRRVALGLLSAFAEDAVHEHATAWFGEARLTAYLQVIERRVNTPLCSSVGRLFDGVAALLGVDRSTFEGHAAIELEALAAEDEPHGGYSLPLCDGVADTEALVRAVLDDLRAGTARSRIARRFHETLIDFAVDAAEHAGVARVALAGGCFQNRLLAEGAAARLEANGFSVLVPSLVPTNDGGISVGQAWIAAHAHHEGRV